MLELASDLNEFKRGFHKYYYEKIFPKLKSLEKERKEQYLVFIIFGVLSLLSTCIAVPLLLLCLLVILCPILLIGNANSIDNISLIALISTVLSLTFSKLRDKTKKDFENKVKSIVIKCFLNYFGQDFIWRSKFGADKQTLEQSLLFEKFNKNFYDDYFQGTFKNHSISISELKLFKGSSLLSPSFVPLVMMVIRRNVLYGEVETFNGLFVEIKNTNKSFSKRTAIVPHTTSGLSFDSKFHIEKIELEDPEFNKMFDVYSQDQTEARYLLTTRFIENYKKYCIEHRRTNLHISFYKNTVNLALPVSKDLFVLGDLSKPMTDVNQIQMLFDEFVAVLSMIDVLNVE